MMDFDSSPHGFSPQFVTPDTMADLRSPQRWRWSSLMQVLWPRAVILLWSDMIAIALAWRLASHLNQFYSPIPAQLVWWTWLGLPSLFWVFTAVTLVVFAQAGLYGLTPQWKNYLRTSQLVSLVYLGSLVVAYFYDPKLDAPRSLFFTAWVSSIVFLIGFRLLATLIVQGVEQRQRQVPVFVIARAERLPELTRVLKTRSHCQIVGAALSSTANAPTTLQSILAARPQEVVAESLPNSELASVLFWQLQRAGITLRLVPSSRELLHRRGQPDIFAGLPTIRVATPLFKGWEYRLKRVMDVGGAAIGVVGLAPLLLGIAIAIKVTSPGPVFFRQERMGLNKQIFQVWKFRTMVVNAPQLQAHLEAHNEDAGALFKLKRDPRITPIGNFLRRTSLDELPQLFNVLCGEMSLVGPRPLPLRDIQHFTPWHHLRHQVMPGITGMWQISGRSDIDNFDDVVRLDLYYIDNWSLNLDLEILVETVRVICFHRGAY